MNPFTPRGRIVDPTNFIGRWGELSVIFDQLAAGQPVLVSGMPAVGKSSLLTHIAQSAAVNLERPDLRGYYLDMAVLPDAATCYKLMTRALGGSGDSPAALEVALLATDEPAVFCFDNAGEAINAGWGSDLLERVGAIARTSLQPRAALPLPADYRPADSNSLAGYEFRMYVVAAMGGTPPPLGGRYRQVGLGAMTMSEVRLLTEAYLDDTGVQFSAHDVRDLADVSLGHPAYLQRAAYHMYIGHTQPGYDWRAAYLDEARDTPVVGAPLPPPVFDGERVSWAQSAYGFAAHEAYFIPRKLEIGDSHEPLLVFAPLLIALVAYALTSNIWLALATLLVAVAIAWLVSRATAARATPDEETGNADA